MAPTTDNLPRLDECRRRIDAVDKVVVALLAERARLALEAGSLKQALALPLSAPAREAMVLARVAAQAPAPLPPDAVARIYRHILDETLALERGMLETGHDRD